MKYGKCCYDCTCVSADYGDVVYFKKEQGCFIKKTKGVVKPDILYYSASFFNKQLRWGRSKCILCNSDTAGISG